VDTNERITSRVLQQLQTIYMLLQWNEENRSAEIATTAVAAAQLQAAVEDTAVPVVAPRRWNWSCTIMSNCSNAWHARLPIHGRQRHRFPPLQPAAPSDGTGFSFPQRRKGIRPNIQSSNRTGAHVTKHPEPPGQSRSEKDGAHGPRNPESAFPFSALENVRRLPER
jgi:hypothetical protein